MTRDWIFVPVIVQVLMTLLIYVRLIKVKIREVRAGRVDKTRSALHEEAWGDAVLQINNNIRNQFELPVVFFVMAAILWAMDSVNGLAIAAAFLFVLSRIAHALIHLGSNYVPNRRRTFTVGWWVLMFMALLVLWELVRRAAGL
jgi:hypothetical protein